MNRQSEQTMELRGASMRGLVVAVDDTGPMQTVDVQTHDGFVRSGIEVYQMFGVATCAPAVGSVVQLMAFGADPGDLVALPMITPALRYGGLAQGEVVLYDNTGDRVALRNGGFVQILAASTIELAVGGTSVTLSSSGIAVVGNITQTGNIDSTGDHIANGISLDNHEHSGIQPGGSNTGPPV
jgi:phage baseplate assembly protein V